MFKSFSKIEMEQEEYKIDTFFFKNAEFQN